MKCLNIVHNCRARNPFFIPHSTPEINSILNVQFSSIYVGKRNEKKQNERLKNMKNKYEKKNGLKNELNKL